MQLQIYRGLEPFCLAEIDQQTEYNEVLLGDKEITAKIVLPTLLDFNLDDYILYRGEAYSLNRVPSYWQKDEFTFEYTLKFESPIYQLYRDFHVDNDDTEFSFDGTANITIYDATKVAKTGDTMTGDLILNSATPPANLSAAPKQYVDNTVNNAIAGLVFKTDVVAASVANVNIASAPATLDGVTLANTNRILLKDQTNAYENGIYIFNGTGSALTRALDADTGVELANKTIPVTSGTVNADAWFKILNDTITIGATNILFSKVGGDGNYTPGAQIQISGNTISVVEDSTHRFATDVEKTAWNGKTSTIKATASLSNTDTNINKHKDVTVTGAVVGDLVEVVEKYFNGGVMLYVLSAKVTATNTVRVYITKIYGNSFTEGESFFVVTALPAISIPQTINLVVFK